MSKKAVMSAAPRDVLPRYLSMGTWKSKQLEKKGKGRSETGKSKGIVASALQKYMCRRNRSHNHPLYGVVMESLGIKKGKKK